MDYNFEWDLNKARVNKKKHKVSFEIATTIFTDSRALSIFDFKHSDEEERWITLGIASNGNMIVVVHTFTEDEDKSVRIRIISARKATKNERKQY